MTKVISFQSPTEISDPSFFLNCHRTAPTETSWVDIVAHIQSNPQAESLTRKARTALSTGNGDEYQHNKYQLACFTPAAHLVGGRKSANIDRLTGLCPVDLDHVGPEKLPQVLAAAKADPHTFLCHLTCSGDGVRILYPYRSSQPEVAYLDAWLLGNEHYALVTGCPHDRSTKDPTRLSFLSHDPDVYFNPDATPFLVLGAEEVKREMASVEQQAREEGIDAYVAKAHDILSRQGESFVEGNRHHYLLQMAQLLNKMGVDRLDTERTLAAIAPRGEKEARDIAQWVYDNASQQFGTWNSRYSFRAPLRQPVPAITGPDDNDNENQGDRPSPGALASGEEILRHIRDHQRMRYNLITDTIELWSDEQHAFVDINDRVQNTLWLDCAKSLGKRVRQQDLNDVIRSEKVEAYDPFLHYLDNLPAWDGTDHIGNLAAHVHVVGQGGNENENIDENGKLRTKKTTACENENVDENGKLRTKKTTAHENENICENESESALFERCFRKWFVGMVASWLDPKVTNQTILTLIGGQGLYKSTFFRRLLPPELERYFLAKGNSSYISKDDKIAVSSYGLIDFEEIDSMKDADLNAVKALVTTEVIAERAAYARNRENRPHLASFCATGNNKHFLTDLTGNRRWLPFEVASIDSPYDHPIDYAALYAQAKHLIANGFQYWFSRDEDLALEAHKRHFAEPCPEEELIQTHFRHPNEYECGTFLSVTEVMSVCCGMVRSNLSTRKLSQALKRLGYKPKASSGKRGFILVAKTAEEIASTRIREAVSLREV